MKRPYITITALIILAVMLTLTGCATKRDMEATNDPEVLYQRGKEAMDSEFYETAIRHFQDLSSRFPFSEHAQQAQLDTAYAYYRFNEPGSAIATADQFIRTYPRHEHVDYAYYVRGLANFDQTRGLLDNFLGADPARRDPRSALESFRYFSELVNRFPDSRYAADAAQRMIHLRNYLARHELHVADYYMRRGAYVAVANRAKHVIETYPQTPSIPDALSLMARAYERLGLDDLAAGARRVLETNYPDALAGARDGEPEPAPG